jgi:hypothetical protein
MMTCAEFEANEMEALHGDLDAATTAVFEEHAASCATCGPRFGRLRTMRRFPELVLEPVPDSLEARILAAVDAAVPPPVRAPVRTAGGAKVFAFLAKPQLAVAAGFILVLGAAMLYTMQSAKREAPSATAAADREMAPMSPAATATAAASAMVVAAGEPMPAPPPAATAAGPAEAKPSDPAFASAKVLYDDGNCRQALPKLEAIAKTSPEADLDAARCVERLKGCAAAAPRYDATAQRNTGTEIGSRATLESARCYRTSGNTQLARARYEALSGDPYGAAEAKSNLDALDQPRAAAGRPAAPATAKPPATVNVAH